MIHSHQKKEPSDTFEMLLLSRTVIMELAIWLGEREVRRADDEENLTIHHHVLLLSDDE